MKTKGILVTNILIVIKTIYDLYFSKNPKTFKGNEIIKTHIQLLIYFTF